MKNKIPEPLQQVYAQMAYELLAEVEFAGLPEMNLPPLDKVIISYGWDGSGNRGSCRMGAEEIAGKDAVIFIRPEEWANPETMLTVLFHEMVHAGLPFDPEDPNDPNKNHEGDFKRICEDAGLDNSGHEPCAAFTERMSLHATQLPPFPAAPLKGQGPEIAVVIRGGGDESMGNGRGEPQKKQKNRHRRWQCDCGIKVRVSRENFDATCNDCGTKFKHRPAPSEGRDG